MMWRQHTFETALDQDRNLCLLAHPHSWLHPQHDYVALVRELESEELRATSERFDRFVDRLVASLRPSGDRGRLKMLRARLEEQEIRRLVGVSGEGDLVVDGVAPLTERSRSLSLFCQPEAFDRGTGGARSTEGLHRDPGRWHRGWPARSTAAASSRWPTLGRPSRTCSASSRLISDGRCGSSPV